MTVVLISNTGGKRFLLSRAIELEIMPSSYMRSKHGLDGGEGSRVKYGDQTRESVRVRLNILLSDVESSLMHIIRMCSGQNLC